MDDADRSTERMEIQMALFEKQRQEAFVPVKPVFYKLCRYCKEEPTINGEPYCCDDCRQDDDRLQKSKKRNGIHVK
jgi:hypothetical protein